MPDLSNLLGAVYGEGTSKPKRDPDGAPVEHEDAADERTPEVPDWADDEHLDAAFAQWKPGPSADAPAAEHEVVEGDSDAPPPLPDDLAAALSEALVESERSESDDADDADDTGAAHGADRAVEKDTDDDPFDRLTPQRAAAAELAAASRLDDAPAPVPVEDPEPVTSPFAPPVSPDEAGVEAAAEAADEPTVTMPVTGRRWDRADDDILPETRSRGFFSFSLRRG
jgi:hypothetical protein